MLNRHSFPVIIVALFAAVLFLFRLPVSKLLNAVLVRPLFAPFEPSVATDLVMLSLLLSEEFEVASIYVPVMADKHSEVRSIEI